MIFCWATSFVLLVAKFVLFRNIRNEDETWYIKKNRLLAMWWAAILFLFLLGFVIDDTMVGIAKKLGIEPIPE